MTAAPIVHEFFAFNHLEPGLAEGVAVDWSPTPGGVVFAVWWEIVEPFASPALADVGPFSGSRGLLAQHGGGPARLDLAPFRDGGLLIPEEPLLLAAQVVDAASLLVVVSQDGSRGGAPVATATGDAVLHALIVPGP